MDAPGGAVGEDTPASRRRFTTAERVAMFLIADGRCQECGAELTPGWHGDHEQPWSKGGLTDIVNGQALCPRCNLAKGDRTVDLRLWQEECLRKFLSSSDDFLCVATPGAGKTIFAGAAARQTWDRGEVRRLVVVVPTSHLRRQWAGSLAHWPGFQLDDRFQNMQGAPARDYDGTVVTYSAVSSQPDLYRRYCSQIPTLVILDEIHHADDDASWGRTLRHAFAPAARRLLLSGTPFRTKGTPIPFVRYSDEGLAQPDYPYYYGAALSDGIVLPIAFPALDGEGRVRMAGELLSTRLSEADDEETVRRVLAAVLDPDGDWIGSVLHRADRELTRIRELTTPNAGGLVVAADQFKARAYAKILHRVSGQQPLLAISDEPAASDRIGDFTENRDRWLVAVQMVSEGVDIPRLAVGVYASNIQTQLTFNQITGRFVRPNGPDDDTSATLFVPSVPRILRYAAEIERLVIPALREAEERAKQEPDFGQMILDLVRRPTWEPAGSSEANHYATILSGDFLPDDELRRADELLRLAGMPPNVTPAQAARMLRLAGAGQVVGKVSLESETATARLTDQKRPLRKKINAKVNVLALRTDVSHSRIHSDLNKLHGDTTPTATLETLQKRLEILDQWLEQA